MDLDYYFKLKPSAHIQIYTIQLKLEAQSEFTVLELSYLSL